MPRDVTPGKPAPRRYGSEEKPAGANVSSWELSKARSNGSRETSATAPSRCAGRSTALCGTTRASWRAILCAGRASD